MQFQCCTTPVFYTKKKPQTSQHTRCHRWFTAVAYPVSLNICWFGISTILRGLGSDWKTWITVKQAFPLFIAALCRKHSSLFVCWSLKLVEKASLWRGSFTKDVPRARISQAAEWKIKALEMTNHACKVKYAMENITEWLAIAPIVQRLEIDAASALWRSRKLGTGLKEHG